MVDQHEKREGSRNSEGRRDSQLSGNTLIDANPLTTPRKVDEKSEKSKLHRNDEEMQVKVKGEDGSLSEASIKVKQLTWIEAGGLMSTEYIVIAILSFPSSFSVLGMAGGVIATVLIGLTVLYTSHVLWRYCMANPGSTDICDLGSRLFPKKFRTAAWYIISIMFLLNNLFIMGLHVLSGAVALNTLSEHSQCTVVFGTITVLIMFILSLPRELNQIALLGFASAFFMLIAFILCLVFLGIQDGPAGWTAGQPITVRVWAAPGTTFVAGFNAFLNIVYTFVGQILIPSYIDDMRKPEDFPKALYLCTALEIIVFTLGGAVGYYYIGDEWITSPAYGSLEQPYVKVVAAFTLPTVIVVGVLYSNVTSRFIFLRIFSVDSVHRLQHTVKGWAIWIAIVFGGFAISFCIGEGLPFFNTLLSLMSSLFDWWFGFVLEGLAFFALYKGVDRWSTATRKAETCLNILIIVAGIFVLVGGCYSSISEIVDDYAAGTVGSAFACENNGF